jgi:transcriptional regulator with XRE-family HTH domain
MNTELDSVRIGEKIRKIRELKGLKQENMAKELGITLNGYGKIERGESSISMERLEQISKVFELGILDILHFDEKVIFNITKMSHSAPNGIVNNYPVSNHERNLYEEQIAALKLVIDTQKKLIDSLSKASTN